MKVNIFLQLLNWWLIYDKTTHITGPRKLIYELPGKIRMGHTVQHKNNVQAQSPKWQPEQPEGQENRFQHELENINSAQRGKAPRRSARYGTPAATGGSDSGRICLILISPKPTRRWIRRVPVGLARSNRSPIRYFLWAVPAKSEASAAEAERR